MSYMEGSCVSKVVQIRLRPFECYPIELWCNHLCPSGYARGRSLEISILRIKMKNNNVNAITKREFNLGWKFDMVEKLQLEIVLTLPYSWIYMPRFTLFSSCFLNYISLHANRKFSTWVSNFSIRLMLWSTWSRSPTFLTMSSSDLFQLRSASRWVTQLIFIC